MLRKIISKTSQTPMGKVLILGVVSSFLVGCGADLGTIGRLPSAPSIPVPDLSVPNMPGTGINIPGLSMFQREARPIGVVAAPGTEWGYVHAAGDDFAGLAVADEPRAALMARNILADGGTAADAATALYFMLAATNPAAASLGGGGVCLVHDARTGIAQSIDFLPRAPRGGGPVAIPGAVRGFAYIQAEYGVLEWNDVVGPSAGVAASHPMSRTLARRVAASNAPFQESNRLRHLFSDDFGARLREGDRFGQANLAGSLGIIANRGAQDMYTGELAYRFIDEASEDGGRITTLDMQSYRPNVSTAQVIELPGEIGFVPAGATGAGFFFPEMTQKSLRGLPQNPAPGTPAIATIQQEAFGVLTDSGIRGDLPDDFGSTSFAVTDATGLTVVCGMTMNGSFGTGTLGRSTGILYARSPSDIEFGLSGAFLTPLIATNPQGTRLHLAAAAAGGPSAAASLLYTAVNAPIMGLEQALAQNGSEETGTVNAISCGRESGDEGRVCRIGVDPRGSGLGAEALR